MLEFRVCSNTSAWRPGVPHDVGSFSSFALRRLVPTQGPPAPPWVVRELGVRRGGPGGPIPCAKGGASQRRKVVHEPLWP